MGILKISQGTKVKVKITALDENGAAVNLANFTKFGFVVYNETGTLFRASTEAGIWDKDITITNAGAGEFEFLMDVADTKQAKPGKYLSELIWFQDDDGTTVIPKVSAMDFMELIQSPTNSITDII